MLIAPGSLLLFFIIAAICCKKNTILTKYKKLLLLDIIIELLMVRGFFVRFGTSEVLYENFMTCFMIIASVYTIIHLQIKISTREFGLGCLLLVVSSIGLFYQAIEPIDGIIMNYNSPGSWDAYSLGIQNKALVEISWLRALVTYLHIVNVVLVVFMFKSTINSTDILSLLRSVNKILKFNVFFVVGEFITKNIFNSNIYTDVLILLLGDGTNTYVNLIERNGLYQLQGITREPSHLAMTLFFTIIFYILEKRLLNKKLKVNNYLYICFCLFLSYISGSFGALLFLLVLLVWFAYLCAIDKGRIFKTFMMLLMIIVTTGFIYALVDGSFDSSSYFGQRLFMATLVIEAASDGTWYGMGGDSAIPRFVSIFDTLGDFAKRPLFGIGLSVEQSHGGLANILADFGVIGLITWCIFVFGKYKYNLTQIIILLVLSNTLIAIGVANCLFMVCVIFLISCLRVNLTC